MDWSDPEGSRPHLWALLLGYCTDEGKLIYAGRVGTGMPVKVLADLRRRLERLAAQDVASERPVAALNFPPCAVDDPAPRLARLGSMPLAQGAEARARRIARPLF